MSTAQEIFSTVAHHLLNQGRKAQDHHDSCFYRFNNLKCAIGILIPDKLYDPDMEGLPIESLLNFPELAPHLLASDRALIKSIQLLEDLQSCHDDEPVEDWKLILHAIAHEFNLNSDDI